MSFQDLGTFAKYIQVNRNQEIELFIYNVDSESVKRSVIEPRDNWGGEGLIGADISFGYCNQLPIRQRDIVNNQKRNQMKNIF